MVDMTFYTRLKEWKDGRQIIVVPNKNYSGRRLKSGKMCKIEITQIEEE